MASPGTSTVLLRISAYALLSNKIPWSLKFRITFSEITLPVRALLLESDTPRCPKFCRMLYERFRLLIGTTTSTLFTLVKARRASISTPLIIVPLTLARDGLLPSITIPLMVTPEARTRMRSFAPGLPPVGLFTGAVIIASNAGFAFGPSGPGTKAAKRVSASTLSCGPLIVRDLSIVIFSI